VTVRPIWLLDIDGVINAAAETAPRHVWPEDAWIWTAAEEGGRMFPLLAARPVLAFIRAVHEAERAEIRWHTTWQEAAANVAEALDLPRFPVQEAPEWPPTEDLAVWWKLPAAERVIDEGRPVVWTDDDAAWHVPRPTRSRLAGRTPLLVIAPHTRAGLSRRHLRRIDSFLKQHAAVPAVA
jgi:hypothetical protein